MIQIDRPQNVYSRLVGGYTYGVQLINRVMLNLHLTEAHAKITIIIHNSNFHLLCDLFINSASTYT